MCPICSSDERELLHSALTDRNFKVAPGHWNLWKCKDCGSAILSPRPTESSIGLAYEKYFTHDGADNSPDFNRLSTFRKFRRILSNGYSNWRYGANNQPSNSLGVFAAFALPFTRTILDRQHRHLPFRTGTSRVLLDVGCGNGSFLILARSCGWRVIGIDPDLSALKRCTENGLDQLYTSIEELGMWEGKVDVITMNHVIEHLHKPCEVLKAAYKLLKPGGTLWIETPNITSVGHKKFGKNWFHLDPPRHLVLFNSSSLNTAINSAGFIDIRRVKNVNPVYVDFQRSYSLATTNDWLAETAMPLELRFSATLARLTTRFMHQTEEFLSVTASKPSE